MLGMGYSAKYLKNKLNYSFKFFQIIQIIKKILFFNFGNQIHTRLSD
jgi:hypothetical protein